RLFICFYISLLLCSCSNKKNTLLSRAYNEMTTRYNIYHNAHEAFLNDLKALEDQFQDDYTSLLPPHPVYELAKDDFSSGMAGFDVTIGKCTKAIQEHSIRTLPKRGKYSLRRVREQAKIEEFNPFMHHVWLLMGEAQFYKGNLLSALSTFNYISRHFRNRPEAILRARLWVIRSYLAMGWTFDAESLLPLIKGVEVPVSLEHLYNTVFFELTLQKQQYQEALTYLQKTIPRTKNKTQKHRLIFLESQLYTLTGNEDKANKALAHLIRRDPSYAGAKPEVLNKKSEQTQKSETSLNKMAYSSSPAKTMHEEQTYADTYKLFKKGEMEKVRTKYRAFIAGNPSEKLLPKFMFLNAIATLSEGDIASFTTELKSLVDKYPKDDVSEIAENIIRGINEGRQLNTHAFYQNNELRTDKKTNDNADSLVPDIPEFEDNPFSPHQIVFVIPKDQSCKNELIYRIARFNFSNFVVREYDIESKETDAALYIIVRGFKGLEELLFYENRLHRDFEFMKRLNKAVELIPISNYNFELLLKEKSRERYFEFYNNLKIKYEHNKSNSLLH
ncbi:MAG: hypothetical protein ACRCXN_05925, partial [Bacteroidales bacterium]